MKKIIYLLLGALIYVGTTSCKDDNLPEMGIARHQIENLIATPGDEEVQLSWEMPEGWSPTDFKITFNDAASKPVEIMTGGEMSYLVKDLVNEHQYTFNVQAIYGSVISNQVKVIGKPTTSRFPVSELKADGGDSEVALTWNKPSNLVIQYLLKYYLEAQPENSKELTLDKDLTSYVVQELENDKNYCFEMTAEYTKGLSEAVVIKAMPNTVIPFTLDRTKAALLQPITFRFNTKDYSDATEVKWTFPGDLVKEGTEVQHGFGSVGAQQVKLSAVVHEKQREWMIEVEIREHVIYTNDWTQNGATYNGLKGFCPVFSPDGKTVYALTFNLISGLYAYDVVSGEEKWRYIPAINTGSYNMLTVNPINGDIYYGTVSNNHFYAVTEEGQLRWEFTEAGSMQSSAPAVNKAGTQVYICDKSGNVFALDALSGTKLWSTPIGGQGGGLLVNGDELVVGTTECVAFLNIHDGSEIKRLTLSKPMTGISGFAVAHDKQTLYVPQRSGCISSINLATHSVIVDSKQLGGNDMYEPVIAPNGSLFIGCKNSHVYNIKTDLSGINWQFEHHTANNGFNFSHPCIDSEGNCYITSAVNATSFNMTYIFSPSGTIIDSWTYAAGDKYQKQMCGNNYLDGVIYSGFIGGGDSNGIFVGKYVGGERASGWSTHGGDICGSCCVK